MLKPLDIICIAGGTTVGILKEGQKKIDSHVLGGKIKAVVLSTETPSYGCGLIVIVKTSSSQEYSMIFNTYHVQYEVIGKLDVELILRADGIY